MNNVAIISICLVMSRYRSRSRIWDRFRSGSGSESRSRTWARSRSASSSRCKYGSWSWSRTLTTFRAETRCGSRYGAKTK